MTSSDDFLTRWSRRKRAVKAEESSPPAQDTTGKSAQPAPDHPAGSDNAPAKQSDPAFDLSKLPSLDSIGPDTDVRMFMQPGVPTALSRAAFRRAWSADPAIRDFIGLSENSWDFTAPDGIEGFGPLVPTDNVKRMLAQLFNEETAKPAAPASDLEANQPESSSGNADDVPARSERLAETLPIEAGPNDQELHSNLADGQTDSLLHRTTNNDATQHGRSDAASFGTRQRRRHGGALPT